MTGTDLERQADVGAIAAGQILFGTSDEMEILERSVRVADTLMKVVHDRGLAFRFNDRDWYGAATYQLLGTFFGLTAELEWCRPLADRAGWEARSVVRGPDGRTLGAAEAMVDRSERNWAKAPDHAVRAMAQVRAQRRAYASVLGFVLAVAGYDVADPSAPATRRQVTALHTVATELGWDDDERHVRAGVESFNDLTRSEAGELLEAWSPSERRSDVETSSRAPEPTRATNAAESLTPSRSSGGLDQAWSLAIAVYGSRVAVLRAALERWPSDRGISASSLGVGELEELIEATE